MARIAFVLDHEEGHLLPTFKLARQLLERGHSVIYLGLTDSGDLVRRQGFELVPILSQVFPEGSVPRLKQDLAGIFGAPGTDGAAGDGQRPTAGEEEVYGRYLGALAKGEGLDGPVAEARPDLFILNSFLGLNALVLQLRFGLPIVLLTPFLRPGTREQAADQLEATLLRLRTGGVAFFELVRRCVPSARRLRDLTGRLLRMPELIQCPQDLDLPKNGGGPEPEVHYIEASVDLSRREDRGFPWERLDPAKKLLYASLGSQSFLVGRETATGFLRAVAEGAARRPDWQLVLATGGQVEPAELPLPSDAVALPWIPQIPVLERAALMVTHGGLGTIKECIFHDVPMVVFPITRDQPDNAKRIVHHGLGLAGDLAGATPEGIFALVEQVDREPSFRQNVARMGRRFREVEESGIGVRKIEEALGACDNSQSAALAAALMR
jgi:UDP:flavonoid glycosyltransferase YjiC (YdhE family)